jgi:hypothetical protein
VVWDERVARRDEADPLYSWVLVTEFFNDSIGDVYRIGGPTYYESVLPTARITTRAGSLTDAGGRSVRPPFVLAICRAPVAGNVIERSPAGILQLVHVEQPLRLLARRRQC